jgi:hypothetical protein
MTSTEWKPQIEMDGRGRHHKLLNPLPVGTRIIAEHDGTRVEGPVLEPTGAYLEVGAGVVTVSLWFEDNWKIEVAA